MTRATVGGINQEDNLWYPLAVNAQGIAQIDTSGIPEPMEWEVSDFSPYYFSSDETGEALIDYQYNYGRCYRLGQMVFAKIILRTRSCVITSPRGDLRVGGLPFTWSSYSQHATWAGTCISKASTFTDGTIIINASGSSSNINFQFQKISGGDMKNVNFTDLKEADGDDSNYLIMSHWGAIISTDPPPARVFRNGILQETDEIPTDTP